jgi:hypothetical protein
MSDDFRKDADGTWTVDFSWAGVRIIGGVPSRELAEQISAALWEAYRAGGDSYAMSQY